MLEMFFANGGNDCFIISVGNYSTNDVNNEDMLAGLELLNNEDLPTLILFPDAHSSLNSEDPSELHRAALAQCADRKDRFLICDVEEVNNSNSESAEMFRNSIGSENLKFGAAYFPSLITVLKYKYSEDKIKVSLNDSNISLRQNNSVLVLRHTEESILADASKSDLSLYHVETGKYRIQYQEIKSIINSQNIELPPSAAMAGLYNNVDSTQGVWRAPANISLNYVISPKIEISNSQQEILNVDITGISINAIRKFSGRGVRPWGARTMAGNDNEWRYVSVRRFALMLEKSIKKAISAFTLEPNDPNTWIKVRTMTENYLSSLWREGALKGSNPEQAFFIKIGVGQTMSYQDVAEGNMNVEIGIATVRPAEFIVLKLTQKMENN